MITKEQKKEYDRIRRATSIKWKEAHTRYYREHAKEIYQKKKIYYQNNPDKKKKNYEDKLKYSRTLKGKIQLKKNFAIRWIKKKYPNNFIDSTITDTQLQSLYDYNNGLCPICKNEFKEFQLDHKISLINGGPHILENIHFICQNCNLKKGKKNLNEYLLETCHFQIG